jgi:hypothetical protein
MAIEAVQPPQICGPLRLHPSEVRGAACAGAGPCERPTPPPPPVGGCPGRRPAGSSSRPACR